jgi:hypothetical protein
VLQFLNHKEGRIVVASTRPVYTNSVDVVDADQMTTVNVDLSEYEGTGEKYVVATALAGSVTMSGVFPAGGAIAVNNNERYPVRAKAYYPGVNPAYLQAVTTFFNYCSLPFIEMLGNWIK